MLKSVILSLFAIALSTMPAFAGKPPASCGNQPVTITLASDTGAPGLYGDGQPYSSSNGVTATWNNCPGSGDAYLGLGGSTRSMVLRFGAPIAHLGTVPSWVTNGATVTAQGSFYVRRLVLGDSSNGMMIYFKGPDRKPYAFQFNNPCVTSPRGGDPLLVNNPLLTSRIWASYSLSGSSAAWDLAADAAADSCDVSTGTLANAAGQAPVGTLMVQSGSLYVNVAQFTFPVQLRVTRP